ncbi:MAG: sensor histidine kinase [Lachnospiraceae bacterium]|nr:sensor histidine kinase [Lachnospiraceae bacterium]
MNLFFQYLKRRWREIVVAIIFFLLFLISFALYHLPIKAVIYPSFLCMALGLLFMMKDFQRVKHKYQLLLNIHDLTDIVIGTLPKVEGIEEEAYQQILYLLSKEYNKFQMITNRKYVDMMDYYTVWVHQIKTPIAAMRLQLQNMQQPNLQQQDAASLRKLSAELFRIEQYVDMVLTFLRLDFENTDYLIKEYDLDTIIKSAVKKFTSEFIGRKLKLVYKPVGVKVITDEKWLSFVLEQVLSNALKYTRSGSIMITLEPEKKLCIKDTGMGIAPEDLPRIFENGYTGCHGRRDKRASGIGLYLCKRICTNLGHRITASSVVDQGTVICIDLSQTELKVE